MSKVAVNIPDEEKSIVDRFVEKIPEYKNRSDLIRKALRKEIRSDYNTLEEVSGSWNKDKANKVEERIKKLNKEDIEAQDRSDN